MRPKRLISLSGRSVAFGVLIFSGVARADLIVTAAVTPVGGLYHYEYEIANDLPTPGVDVLLVDIIVLPLDATLTNLFAPVGFQSFYDSGLGIVTFLPDLGSADLFEVGGTHSGFGFDSAHPAGLSAFQALTLAGDPIDGPTQAPVAPVTNVIPEPGSITLLLGGLGMFAAFRNRKSAR